MQEGREKYYSQDYLEAYVNFASAHEAATALADMAMKARGETFDDPEANMRVESGNSSLSEAQTMLDRASAKNDSLRTADIRRFAAEATQSRLESELRDFILIHKDKGVALFQSGLYEKAIREWQSVLDRINETNTNGNSLPSWVDDIPTQLQDNINTAKTKLEGDIKDAITEADVLAKRGQFVQALEVLTRVRGAATSDADRKKIAARITSLRSQSTFEQSYEQGVRLYERQDWKGAMAAFERASQIKRNHKQAKKYFDDAKARSLATVQQLAQENRGEFIRGQKFAREGNLKEALKLYSEALKKQPYNKRILDAIDDVREKLKNE